MKTKMMAATAVLFALTLTGCADDGSWRVTAAQSSCEDSVKAQLKDPDSAQFRNVVAVKTGEGTYKVTGEVNALNSFGARAGYQQFYCAAIDSGSEVKGVAKLVG